ncbi:PEP-CTERM domain protein [Oopsacas minuta]|uniref:PEP-CTERM domain protein n=1 Tax=Oopsacas minuta TaxID=111878 RepID=A0AAV7K6U5_9METZ|nr:PEP-CTERM domain protein [Oopsacas minuta]
MNEEYSREIFSCQECDCIKEHSLLLDCFHNICRDCENEDNGITCNSCPDNVQKSREGIIHQLNQLLHTSFNNPEPEDHIAKNCAMCDKTENTIYCTVCKTFWCELHLEEFHVNGTFAGADRHKLVRDVSKLNLQALITGEGDEEDETRLNEMLEVLKELDQEGKENQLKLEGSHSKIDEKMREEEHIVGKVFEGIYERMERQKSLILGELNDKCNTMHEKLEENMKINEIKLSRINRAVNLITKMMQHKVIAEPMEKYFIERNIVEKNRTVSPEDVNHEINWEDSSHLPLKMFEANDSPTINNPDLRKSCIKSTIEKSNFVSFVVDLKDEFNQNIRSLPAGHKIRIALIKDDYTLTIPEKTLMPTYDEHYSTTIRLPDGTYHACLCKYMGEPTMFATNGVKFRVGKKTLELVTPKISTLHDPGLVRAITATNDSLYSVVKDPPEIRKYCYKMTYEGNIHSSGTKSFEDCSISFETNFGEGLLGSPCGICYLDAEVYVVDAGFNCVHVFTNTGVYIERFGSTGKGLGQFQRPMGIDYDYLNKEILIADTYNNRIQSCVMDTKRCTAFGTNDAFVLKDPVDVKSCKNGNTVVTTLAGQVVIYEFRIVILLIMDGILTPRHCCIDSSDNIYVTSHLGHCVYIIKHTEGSDNNFERLKLKTHPDFRRPTGIATNSEGQLFVISRELNPESTLSFLSIW